MHRGSLAAILLFACPAFAWAGPLHPVSENAASAALKAKPASEHAASSAVIDRIRSKLGDPSLRRRHPAYRLYAMISSKIDRKEWRSFLDSLSRLLEGKRAEVEVASLDLGDQIEVEWLPLIGIVYDPKDNVVEVALDGMDHIIYQPQEIHFAEEAGRFFGIDIMDGKGAHQIVKMKEPLMLPAPQA